MWSGDSGDRSVVKRRSVLFGEETSNKRRKL